MRSSEEADRFIAPDWDRDVHNPFQFRQVVPAIERIFRAMEAGERMTIHGDYDADGVTGSALLISTLVEIERHMRNAGPSLIDYYIPHRDKEGYGLRRETVSLLAERGTRLIITVDCGIACVDEIAFAKTQGMDTIVVDHHAFGTMLPDGFLIHPGLPEETYPFTSLAAVGVAFKFACALLSTARDRAIPIVHGWEKWLLDLVAIATVTDMVPLIGENRVLQTYGLRVLNKTRRIGLRALMESSGLVPGSLDTVSVGFTLGPRINAAGRMDHASLALRLLLSESEDDARQLARELEGRNRERQEVMRRMMTDAERMLHERYGQEFPPLLYLFHPDWSPALVGLVAGRFLDRYGRPSVIVGRHGDTWIGSGRSTDTYNITDAVRTAGEGILTRSGGHKQACGFSLVEDGQLGIFGQRLMAHAGEKMTAADREPRLTIDAEIGLDTVDWEFIQNMKRLEPFGEGNQRPLFLTRGCRIAAADTVGAANNHLRLVLIGGGGRRIKAIGFRLGERLPDVPIGGTMDFVYHVDVNEWNGRKEIQCKIVDLR